MLLDFVWFYGDRSQNHLLILLLCSLLLKPRERKRERVAVSSIVKTHGRKREWVAVSSIVKTSREEEGAGSCVQYCYNFTRGRGRGPLCPVLLKPRERKSERVAVSSIVKTSREEEGVGRCVRIVETSREEEWAGRCVQYC